MHKMAANLKEVGLVTFLRDYLSGGDGDEIPSLRKLILGFGIIPVSLRIIRPTRFDELYGPWQVADISQYPFDIPQPQI